ncbi:alpha-N-arabinofuranosidase [Secundilactobacillus folii]|uniref:non-reducing end alpha-L-arabinofuranosidase n=1 Tax=Secundilactobacillus folii TaxID=2678357 RepID=A0A7X2XV74_9LACO|nr:alpha-L-arabinofuranosidase C-terminal domain-containing protein [Secundilactobacillus folii]MTV81670.1 alpha-N-arabinofuranosidase [Secundilactobacillus folii]
MNSTYTYDKNFQLGNIDNKVWSSFTEHLGRSIYGGIYDPNKSFSDNNGFRKDVKKAVKDLNLGVIRYPGGNFVSNYNWKDGIGPKENRKKTMEFAWSSIETNQFGIDDFCRWAEEVGVEPMIAVNLGTGSIRSAAELVEYCNHDHGTYWSDLRIKNGHRQPYNVKYWCLGNEMEGDWQAGHMSAQQYADKAREAAKMMKWVDKSIKLVACGSSYEMLPTYLEWDKTIMKELYPYVDYISTHNYNMNSGQGTLNFLSSWKQLDNHLKNTENALDFVKSLRLGKKDDKKDIKICLDEWNVWNFQDIKLDNLNDLAGMTTFELTSAKKWEEHPAILQEKYSLLDALTVGGLGITILNNANYIEIACLAQLLNVIAPITTDESGHLLKQTIYYPFELLSKYGRGTVLEPRVSGDTLSTDYGDLPVIAAATVYDKEKSQLKIFALNMDTSNTANLRLNFNAFDGVTPKKQIILTDDNLKARNTFKEPNKVVPTEINLNTTIDKLSLPKNSWSVIICDVNSIK